MGFKDKADLIDLKLALRCRAGSVAEPRKGTPHKYRQTSVRATDGLRPRLPVSQMHRALSRRVQSAGVFLLEPVLVRGVCPTDLSREPTRHRSVSALGADQALPRGDSWNGGAQYIGSCQCGSELAHLCRLRTGITPLTDSVDRASKSNFLSVQLKHEWHESDTNGTKPFYPFGIFVFRDSCPSCLLWSKGASCCPPRGLRDSGV